MLAAAPQWLRPLFPLGASGTWSPSLVRRRFPLPFVRCVCLMWETHTQLDSFSTPLLLPFLSPSPLPSVRSLRACEREWREREKASVVPGLSRRPVPLLVSLCFLFRRRLLPSRERRRKKEEDESQKKYRFLSHSFVLSLDPLFNLIHKSP